MNLASPSFANDASIPAKHARDGDNLSPPLTISGVPDAARSLALILEDIDSPMGIFTHWVVWNVPSDTTGIAEGMLPAEAEVGMNGFGEVRYDGPCPPSGRHRYRFRLLALDQTLDAPTGDRKDQIAADMAGCVITEATLTGWYDATF